MGIYLGGQVFSGPFEDSWRVDNKSGLYAILDGPDRTARVLLMGESVNLREAVDLSLKRKLKKDSWEGMYIAVRYTPGIQQEHRHELMETVKKKIEETA